MKVIDIIGYSGSGKTFFITTTIKLLKKTLGYNVAVIKNVKHHHIDKKGKDSCLFRDAGASYSIIQNRNFETAIFMNTNEDDKEQLLEWIEIGPYKIDLVLTEGFRNLKNPTVLCVSKIDEIKDQLSDDIKMISGIICSNESCKEQFMDLPIINIEKHFSKFLKIFNI